MKLTSLSFSMRSNLMKQKTPYQNMHPYNYFFRFLAFGMLAIALVFLGGCATTGAKPAEMQNELDRIPANKARIYFYRSSTMVGVAVQPNISLNGSVVGESKPGGFFYVDVEPGVHEVTARTEVMAQLSVTVRSDETRYVRSSIGLGLFVGRIALTLVDPDQAQQELSSLSFTGSTGAAGPSASPLPPSVTPDPSIARNRAPAKPVTLDDLDALLPKK